MHTKGPIPPGIAHACTQSIWFLEVKQQWKLCMCDNGDIVLLKQYAIPTKDINLLMLPHWQFHYTGEMYYDGC